MSHLGDEHAHEDGEWFVACRTADAVTCCASRLDKTACNSRLLQLVVSQDLRSLILFLEAHHMIPVRLLFPILTVNGTLGGQLQISQSESVD